MDPRIDEVLDYWFGEIEDGFSKEDRDALWFGHDADTDREIRERFEDLVLAAGHGKLNGWKNTPRGRLALLILLDQFTRNIYRGRKDAFQFDALARAIAVEGLNLKHDQALSWVERRFFYLPFEHSEDLRDQLRCIALFEALRDAGPESRREQMQRSVDYAVKHKDIIERFGRFPHRNEVLGRQSTAEEIAYLQDGERFGQ